MNVRPCPQKITTLKEKLIEVHQLLVQFKEARSQISEFQIKERKYLKHLKSLSRQYIKVISDNNKLENDIESYRRTCRGLEKALEESELRVVQLRQLIDVYNTERREYGPDKVEQMEQQMDKLGIRVIMERTRTGTGEILSNTPWFKSTFSRQLKKWERAVNERTTQSNNRKKPFASPAWSIESGFESMQSSPASTENNEFKTVKKIKNPENDVKQEKNDPKEELEQLLQDADEVDCSETENNTVRDTLKSLTEIFRLGSERSENENVDDPSSYEEFSLPDWMAGENDQKNLEETDDVKLKVDDTIKSPTGRKAPVKCYSSRRKVMDCPSEETGGVLTRSQLKKRENLVGNPTISPSAESAKGPKKYATENGKISSIFKSPEPVVNEMPLLSSPDFVKCGKILKSPEIVPAKRRLVVSKSELSPKSDRRINPRYRKAEIKEEMPDLSLSSSESFVSDSEPQALSPRCTRSVSANEKVSKNEMCSVLLKPSPKMTENTEKTSVFVGNEPFSETESGEDTLYEVDNFLADASVIMEKIQFNVEKSPQKITENRSLVTPVQNPRDPVSTPGQNLLDPGSSYTKAKKNVICNDVFASTLQTLWGKKECGTNDIGWDSKTPLLDVGVKRLKIPNKSPLLDSCVKSPSTKPQESVNPPENSPLFEVVKESEGLVKNLEKSPLAGKTGASYEIISPEKQFDAGVTHNPSAWKKGTFRSIFDVRVDSPPKNPQMGVFKSPAKKREAGKGPVRNLEVSEVKNPPKNPQMDVFKSPVRKLEMPEAKSPVQNSEAKSPNKASMFDPKNFANVPLAMTKNKLVKNPFAKTSLSEDKIGKAKDKDSEYDSDITDDVIRSKLAQYRIPDCVSPMRERCRPNKIVKNQMDVRKSIVSSKLQSKNGIQITSDTLLPHRGITAYPSNDQDTRPQHLVRSNTESLPHSSDVRTCTTIFEPTICENPEDQEGTNLNSPENPKIVRSLETNDEKEKKAVMELELPEWAKSWAREVNEILTELEQSVPKVEENVPQEGANNEEHCQKGSDMGKGVPLTNLGKFRSDEPFRKRKKAGREEGVLRKRKKRYSESEPAGKKPRVTSKNNLKTTANKSQKEMSGAPCFTAMKPINSPGWSVSGVSQTKKESKKTKPLSALKKGPKKTKILPALVKKLLKVLARRKKNKKRVSDVIDSSWTVEDLSPKKRKQKKECKLLKKIRERNRLEVGAMKEKKKERMNDGLHEPGRFVRPPSDETEESPMSPEESPMSPEESPMSPEESPMSPEESPMSPIEPPISQEESPMSPEESPISPEESPMSSEESPMSPEESSTKDTPMSPEKSQKTSVLECQWTPVAEASKDDWCNAENIEDSGEPYETEDVRNDVFPPDSEYVVDDTSTDDTNTQGRSDVYYIPVENEEDRSEAYVEDQVVDYQTDNQGIQFYQPMAVFGHTGDTKKLKCVIAYVPVKKEPCGVVCEEPNVEKWVGQSNDLATNPTEYVAGPSRLDLSPNAFISACYESAGDQVPKSSKISYQTSWDYNRFGSSEAVEDESPMAEISKEWELFNENSLEEGEFVIGTQPANDSKEIENLYHADARNVAEVPEVKDSDLQPMTKMPEVEQIDSGNMTGISEMQHCDSRNSTELPEVKEVDSQSSAELPEVKEVDSLSVTEISEVEQSDLRSGSDCDYSTDDVPLSDLLTKKRSKRTFTRASKTRSGRHITYSRKIQESMSDTRSDVEKQKPSRQTSRSSAHFCRVTRKSAKILKKDEEASSCSETGGKGSLKNPSVMLEDCSKHCVKRLESPSPFRTKKTSAKSADEGSKQVVEGRESRRSKPNGSVTPEKNKTRRSRSSKDTDQAENGLEGNKSVMHGDSPKMKKFNSPSPTRTKVRTTSATSIEEDSKPLSSENGRRSRKKGSVSPKKIRSRRSRLFCETMKQELKEDLVKPEILSTKLKTEPIETTSEDCFDVVATILSPKKGTRAKRSRKSSNETSPRKNKSRAFSESEEEHFFANMKCLKRSPKSLFNDFAPIPKKNESFEKKKSCRNGRDVTAIYQEAHLRSLKSPTRPVLQWASEREPEPESTAQCVAPIIPTKIFDDIFGPGTFVLPPSPPDTASDISCSSGHVASQPINTQHLLTGTFQSVNTLVNSSLTDSQTKSLSSISGWSRCFGPSDCENSSLSDDNSGRIQPSSSSLTGTMLPSPSSVTGTMEPSSSSWTGTMQPSSVTRSSSPSLGSDSTNIDRKCKLLDFVSLSDDTSGTKAPCSSSVIHRPKINSLNLRGSSTRNDTSSQLSSSSLSPVAGPSRQNRNIESSPMVRNSPDVVAESLKPTRSKKTDQSSSLKSLQVPSSLENPFSNTDESCLGRNCETSSHGVIEESSNTTLSKKIDPSSLVKNPHIEVKSSTSLVIPSTSADSISSEKSPPMDVEPSPSLTNKLSEIQRIGNSSDSSFPSSSSKNSSKKSPPITFEPNSLSGWSRRFGTNGSPSAKKKNSDKNLAVSTNNDNIKSTWALFKKMSNKSAPGPVPAPVPSVLSHPPVHSIVSPPKDMGELLERSKMMKLKPSVLIKECNPSVPDPGFKEEPIEGYNPMVALGRSVEKKPKSGLLDDILFSMEKPPELPKPVPVAKEKKKKNKKSKKKKEEVPIVIVPPKFSNATVKEAWEALNTFVTGSYTTDAEAEAATSVCCHVIHKSSNRDLLRAILTIVAENLDEEVDWRFTPPAPPLTPTQNRLFALFAKAKLQHLYPGLLREIEARLLPETFIYPDDAVESCARFYAAICHQLESPTRLLLFLIKLATGMKQRGCVPVLAVLLGWPELIPLADNCNPYNPGAVLALLMTVAKPSSQLSQGQCLVKLKKLLTSHYNYPDKVNLATWASDALAAVRVAGDLAAERALCTVSRAHDPSWCQDNLVSPLMEHLGAWQFGGATDERACRMLRVLTSVLLLVKEDSRVDVVNRLGGMLLSGKVSPQGEEELCRALVRIRTQGPISDILRQWNPRVVNNEIKNLVTSYLANKPFNKAKQKKKPLASNFM